MADVGLHGRQHPFVCPDEGYHRADAVDFLRLPADLYECDLQGKAEAGRFARLLPTAVFRAASRHVHARLSSGADTPAPEHADPFILWYSAHGRYDGILYRQPVRYKAPLPGGQPEQIR